MSNSRGKSRRRIINMKTVSEDRCFLSRLPGDLQREIAQWLPIRDLVRTSVLSKEWRDRWKTTPQLIFDEHCLKQPSRKILTMKFARTIDQVLTQHSGPIRKFKLTLFYIQIPDSDTYVKKWIDLLSKKDIRDLSVEIIRGEQVKLESYVCACERLEVLRLRKCSFSPPESFEGFKYLKELHLEALAIPDKDFVKLTSSSFLEKLTLVNMFMHPLKIQIPTLKYLHIQGVFLFRNLHIEDAEQVAFLLLHLSLPVLGSTIVGSGKGDTRKLIQVLGCVPNVKKLEVWSHSLKFLTIGGVPPKLPFMLNCLKDIFLSINLDDWDQLSAALCLIRSSPNLEQLRLGEWLKRKSQETTASKFWREQRQISCCFNSLRILILEKFSRAVREIEFLEHILKRSPKLERVDIKVRGDIQNEDMMRLERLSLFNGVRPLGNIILIQNIVEVDFERGLSKKHF